MSDQSVRLIAQGVQERSRRALGRLEAAADWKDLQSELRELVEMIKSLAAAVERLDPPDQGPPTNLRPVH
jgi:hypothetical protein